jgi:predicted CXXCH cytochrome family protein
MRSREMMPMRLKSMILVAVCMAALAGAVAMSAPAWADGAPVCTDCHTDKAEAPDRKGSLHPAVEMGCESCHSDVDATDAPHTFTGAGPKGLMASAPELCYMCHDKTAYTEGAHVHYPASDGLCTDCHDPHNSVEPSLLLERRPDLCYACHEKSQFYGTTIHSPVSLGGCNDCHAAHVSENPKLVNDTGSGLCFGCHSDTEFTRKNVHYPVAEGMCTECHRPHASQSDYLLTRRGNILCRKCHAEVEKSPHAVSVFLPTAGHPVFGRRDPNRRGKVFDCLSCHVPHSSDSVSLFRYPASSVFDLCRYCHKQY